MCGRPGTKDVAENPSSLAPAAPSRGAALSSVGEGDACEPSAALRASAYLRNLMFDGSIRPGDRVDQNEIAAALRVSRQPVREAVLELAADGLLDVRPQHGVFVGPFNVDTVRDHFELYGVLRGYAAAKVAKSVDPETLSRLQALHRVATNESRVVALDAATAEFFRTINVAAHNLRLRVALRSMSRFVPGNFYERYPEAIALSHRGSKQILHAIEQGDPDKATAACSNLWRAGGEIVVADLTSRGVLTEHA